MENQQSSTPLHQAARYGHAHIVRPLLLTPGGDQLLHARDGYGNTPLHLACANKRLIVVATLLVHGADINSTNNAGNTPLHRATSNEHDDIVQFLLDNGANVDASDLQGHTPLMVACEVGNRYLINMFLRRGADHEATNNNGQNAIQLIPPASCPVLRSLNQIEDEMEREDDVLKMEHKLILIVSLCCLACCRHCRGTDQCIPSINAHHSSSRTPRTFAPRASSFCRHVTHHGAQHHARHIRHGHVGHPMLLPLKLLYVVATLEDKSEIEDRQHAAHHTRLVHNGYLRLVDKNEEVALEQYETNDEVCAFG